MTGHLILTECNFCPKSMKYGQGYWLSQGWWFDCSPVRRQIRYRFIFWLIETHPSRHWTNFCGPLSIALAQNQKIIWLDISVFHGISSLSDLRVHPVNLERPSRHKTLINIATTSCVCWGIIVKIYFRLIPKSAELFMYKPWRPKGFFNLNSA